MRLLMAALVALAWAGLARAQQVLSPAEFRDAGIAYLRAADAELEFELVDDLGVIIRNPSAEGDEMEEMRINFDRGYSDYLDAPETLEDILGRWVRLVTAPAREHGHDRLISVIRHRDMADVTYNGQAPSLVWRPFAGDLIELLAFDSAEQIEFATHDTLNEVGLTPEQAWTLTPENVRTRMGVLERETLTAGIDLLSGANGITPSLLSVPDFCAAPETANRLYLVLDRNLIAIADGRRRADRAQFLAFASQVAAARESLSASPLECRDGRLQAAGEQ
ncbi:MAG: hypothetical protein R3C16_02460 [Hyphomonadaceae bacterium]